jgi:hypothetical protein
MSYNSCQLDRSKESEKVVIRVGGEWEDQWSRDGFGEDQPK